MIAISDLIAQVRKLAAANPNVIYLDSQSYDGFGGTCRCTKGCSCQEDVLQLTGPMVYRTLATGGKRSGGILGQALMDLGIDKDELERHNDWPIEAVLLKVGVQGTDKEVNWLSLVQRYQNERYEWYQVIEMADAWKYGLS